MSTLEFQRPLNLPVDMSMHTWVMRLCHQSSVLLYTARRLVRKANEKLGLVTLTYSPVIISSNGFQER